MSLQPAHNFATPHQAHSIPNQAPSCLSAVLQSQRASRRQADKRHKALLRWRVLQHLREVEQKYQGQTRCSIRLYINHCNSGSPPNEPLCSCILFGKNNYFFDEERKSSGPPIGFRILVLYDNGTVDDKDFKDDSD